MKKIMAFLLCSLLLFTALCPAVSATSVESDIERFDDGSYLTVTYYKPTEGTSPDGWEDTDATEESDAVSFFGRIIRFFRNLLNKLLSKQETITKTKYCNYFDSEGELLWSVQLKGTFTYNHKTSVCISSEITDIIMDSDWKLQSRDCREEGNTAIGEFAIRQYKLG
ncbi:MAG: hypothetical protein J6Q79_04800, partial [Clostridia bacterium]|nr:hypothetical protein [Clostridia bacterium]